MAEEIIPPTNTQTITTTVAKTVVDDAPTTPDNDPSHIGTVSVRSLICLIFAISVCILSFMSVPIPEILGNLTLGAIGFLFGHSVGSKKT